MESCREAGTGDIREAGTGDIRGIGCESWGDGSELCPLTSDTGNGHVKPSHLLDHFSKCLKHA